MNLCISCFISINLIKSCESSWQCRTNQRMVTSFHIDNILSTSGSDNVVSDFFTFAQLVRFEIYAES